MGGAVSGIRQMIPPQGPLARETDCCDEGMVDRSQQYPNSESRPFRLRHPADRVGVSAAISGAAYGGTDECCDPDSNYYASRDPWYTQSQANRPTFDVVLGGQMSRPMTAMGMNAAAVTSEPPPPRIPMVMALLGPSVTLCPARPKTAGLWRDVTSRGG